MSIQFITWVKRELITENKDSRRSLSRNSLEVECAQHCALKMCYSELFGLNTCH